MCKLLLMTAIKNSNLAAEFMMRMSIPMTKRNDDGVGYTAVKTDGSMFSQRWLKPAHAFDTVDVMTPEIAAKLKKFENRLPKGALDVNYSEQGKLDFEDLKSLTLHARYATCGKEFANTHPFIDQDISLVHNGGISNHLTLGVNKISTCDSEAALQMYIQHDVLNNPMNAQAWLDSLAGRWAFGVFGKTAKGVRILDVVRGESNLYYCEVPEIGVIFATDNDDIKEVLKDMKLESVKAPFLIESNIMYRFNAVTGRMIEDIKLKDSILNIKQNAIHWGKSGYWVNGVWTKYGEKSVTVTGNDTEMITDEFGFKQLVMKTNLVKKFQLDPELLGVNGKADYRKVNLYCRKSTEDIINRLEVWDAVYGTKYLMVFDMLTDEEKNSVELMDFQEDFQTAVKLMKQLYKETKKA